MRNASFWTRPSKQQNQMDDPEKERRPAQISLKFAKATLLAEQMDGHGLRKAHHEGLVTEGVVHLVQRTIENIEDWDQFGEVTFTLLRMSAVEWLNTL